MSEPAWELPDVTPLTIVPDTSPIAEWKGPPPPGPTVGTIGGWDVDGGMVIMPAAGADEPPHWASRQDALRSLSAILSMLPVVGTVKDAAEFVTGSDLVTGEKLSTTQRIINFAAVVGDLVSFGEIGAELRLAEGEIKAEMRIGVRVVKAAGDAANKYNDMNDLDTLFMPH
jgi:hypothetical protein